MMNPKQLTTKENPDDSRRTVNAGNNTRSLLAEYFPIIRTRKEVLQKIMSSPSLSDQFQQWTTQQQEEFLDFCSGMKGMKVLYDGIFKEVCSPESAPERLENLLSLLLKREVRIKTVLPNDSVRLGAESALIYTDIIVELEDGSLADVEVQKIGFAFPGERSACYSSDHLLRQYKRIRSEKSKNFTYRDIKSVYTIVFFERSPAVFKEYPNQWIHHFKQMSDTGVPMNLLLEYIYVPLDIFRENMENKPIETELEAWFAFLSFEEPERIRELIVRFPRFRAMYRDIYEICLNMEKVMSMYSKELLELDHNTVMYMVDEMQAQIDEQKNTISQKDEQLSRQGEELKQKDRELEELKKQLVQLQAQLSK